MYRNSEAKRRAAEYWYKRIQYNQRYGAYAFRLKKAGFTYCEIMDYFAGKGYK